MREHATAQGQPSVAIGDAHQKSILLRRAAGRHDATVAPPITPEVLRAPGQSLDPATRALMESRFAHEFSAVRATRPAAPQAASLVVSEPTDSAEQEAQQVAGRVPHTFSPERLGRPVDFSRVRVHTDARAAESARSVNALAYTVGSDVVFAQGQYAPATEAGRRLLAHELVHVVQQAAGTAHALHRQARPRPAPVDADAQRIIDLAQNVRLSLEQRGPAVVQAIINQYFPNDAAKISRINFREAEPGLGITYAGRGASTTGIIEVGRSFLENTTQTHFARRVAQVRHEIEHVEQQRAGMSGPARQDEREFLAFYHEALFRELPGTGRMQHSTRASLIDAALGYYHCLSSDLRQTNAARRVELIERRTLTVRRSGRTDLGEAPTACRRQRD